MNPAELYTNPDEMPVWLALLLFAGLVAIYFWQVGRARGAKADVATRVSTAYAGRGLTEPNVTSKAAAKRERDELDEFCAEIVEHPETVPECVREAQRIVESMLSGDDGVVEPRVMSEAVVNRARDDGTGRSVTQRIKEIKQPRGGYINPRTMLHEVSLGTRPPHDLKEENVSPGLVGTVVDYLTRFMCGTPVAEAFSVSLAGAHLLDKILASMGEKPYALAQARELAAHVTGLDDASITAACRLVGFDTVYRAGPQTYRPVDGIIPNRATIENIRTMVGSGITFFAEYGPVTHDGITFKGGYTGLVSYGDGDFMTRDAVWDFKCSVKPPTSGHTLQVAMYWLLGLHSVHAEEYRAIKRLGFFNPRLGSVYTVNVADIPAETLHEIETTVIGYGIPEYGEDKPLF